ncbi:MAG: polyprenyl synthetase family protein [Limnohabitans sp.]|nr:polyprenyl synthetase family protein [Limnohabitans sp.]
MSAHLNHIEQHLIQWVPLNAPAQLGESMRYAALDGGKRLRPLLVMATFESIPSKDSWREQAAMRAACAVELIHAYSLVHDDMPCMDNDVLRRGKPTVHVQFGEADALLAGDALQALAFELLTPIQSSIPDQLQAQLCRVLSRAAGYAGMAGGQAIDLASVGQSLNAEQLQEMHRLKTGALLLSSVQMGALCADIDDEAAHHLQNFGQAVGLVFQIVDDILDVTTDSSVLGKTAGKDAQNDKPTYVSLWGLAGAQQQARQLREQAHESLEKSKLSHTLALNALADMVIQRIK